MEFIAYSNKKVHSLFTHGSLYVHICRMVMSYQNTLVTNNLVIQNNGGEWSENFTIYVSSI